jgi:hypothetical protein
MEAAADDSGPSVSLSSTKSGSKATYKAPRIAPQFYDDGSLKKNKLSSRDREKASRSRLMRDLRSQFDNAPEELSAEGTGYSAKEMATELDEAIAEKDRFEEDNFIRLNMSKRERKQREKLAASGGMSRFRNEFETFDDFDEISGLAEGPREKGRGKRKSDFLDDYIGAGRSEKKKSGKRPKKR